MPDSLVTDEASANAMRVRSVLTPILASYADTYRFQRSELQNVQVEPIPPVELPFEPIKGAAISAYNVVYRPAVNPLRSASLQPAAMSRQARAFFATFSRALMKEAASAWMHDDKGNEIEKWTTAVVHGKEMKQRVRFPLGAATAPEDKPECLFMFTLPDNPDGTANTKKLLEALSSMRYELRKNAPQTGQMER